MTSRMLHRGLAAAFASLVLACGADDNIESSREAVPGAARPMAVTAGDENEKFTQIVRVANCLL
jgi:hypothetical protein